MLFYSNALYKLLTYLLINMKSAKYADFEASYIFQVFNPSRWRTWALSTPQHCHFSIILDKEFLFLATTERLCFYFSEFLHFHALQFWRSVIFMSVIFSQPTLAEPLMRQASCSNGCQWLFNGVMRFPSAALSPPNNVAVVTLLSLVSGQKPVRHKPTGWG